MLRFTVGNLVLEGLLIPSADALNRYSNDFTATPSSSNARASAVSV